MGVEFARFTREEQARRDEADAPATMAEWVERLEQMRNWTVEAVERSTGMSSEELSEARDAALLDALRWHVARNALDVVRVQRIASQKDYWDQYDEALDARNKAERDFREALKQLLGGE